ncbi:DUF975 family protein [Streptococcus oricebi]|uniref:Integral membrane protein n=1 Tax=Streptococcus oricebi TaxID=1547447 RepID=A0ABS5B679_9STRE|nr:DUF975 family protein [Streptococcus oricebi]MBP2624231.1 hypothetical protein [Streptococcus oricebi]
MNLTELRNHARLTMRQIEGFFPLFLPPIFINFLHLMLAPRAATVEENARLTWEQFLHQELNRQAFPLVLSFITSIFLISASFALLDVIHKKKEKVGIRDAFSGFSNDKLRYIFPALIMKELALILWNGLIWWGSLLAAFSSYKISLVSQKLGIGQTSSGLPKELMEVISAYGPNLFLGLVLLALGLALLLPQQYAYSQLIYLVYDKSNEANYPGSWQLLRESRQLMRGYKGKRFVLDLTFIPWQILAFLTMGLANFIVYPYIALSQIFFYQQLKIAKSFENK